MVTAKDNVTLPGWFLWAAGLFASAAVPWAVWTQMQISGLSQSVAVLVTKLEGVQKEHLASDTTNGREVERIYAMLDRMDNKLDRLLGIPAEHINNNETVIVNDRLHGYDLIGQEVRGKYAGLLGNR